jgi:GxxExxY protein
VGEYIAQIVVDGSAVVQLKTAERIAPEHQAQMLNYLRAAGLRVGLRVNFHGTRLNWKRLVT